MSEFVLKHAGRLVALQRLIDKQASIMAADVAACVALQFWTGSSGGVGLNTKRVGNPVRIVSCDAFVHAASHSASCDVLRDERTPVDVKRESASILS
jgi:hypothetical protein